MSTTGGVGGSGEAGRSSGADRSASAGKSERSVSKSEAEGITADALGTSDQTAASVGESISASKAVDTVETASVGPTSKKAEPPAAPPGLLESAATWAGQTAKGYATGAVNGVLDMANVVNMGVNAGLEAAGFETRLQTDMKLEPTSPAERAAQQAVEVAALATGVAGAVKSAPTLARALDGAVDLGRSALGLGPKGTTGAAVAGGAVAAGVRLGDLNPAEVAKIQSAAETLGADLYVVGSAAKGARRNVGSDLPLAEFGGSKVGTRSDIDYAVKNGLDDAASKLDLPDMDSSWGVRGVDYLNLDNSPAIRFSSGQPPEVLTGGGRLNLD